MLNIFQCVLMVERARALQRERGLANVAWHVGDVARLPFTDVSFTLVFSRYSFHHLLEPAAAFATSRAIGSANPTSSAAQMIIRRAINRGSSPA